MNGENHAWQPTVAIVKRARDPHTTDHELATLARSEEPMVRAAVAERTEAPMTILLRLAEDEVASVRAAVARNEREDLPLEVREQLAKDWALEVLYALLRNPTVPDSVVARLARSRHRDIATAARRRTSGKGFFKTSVLRRSGVATS